VKYYDKFNFEVGIIIKREEKLYYLGFFQAGAEMAVY